MAFSDLSADLQNIILVNFEFVAKSLLIFGFFFLAIYLLYKFKRADQTPYIAVGILRIVALCTSATYLFFSPLYILMLYPQFPLSTMILWLFFAMLVVFFLVIIFLAVNLIFYSPMYFLDKVGVKMGMKGSNKVFRSIDNILGYKHG